MTVEDRFHMVLAWPGHVLLGALGGCLLAKTGNEATRLAEFYIAAVVLSVMAQAGLLCLWV